MTFDPRRSSRFDEMGAITIGEVSDVELQDPMCWESDLGLREGVRIDLAMRRTNRWSQRLSLRYVRLQDLTLLDPPHLSTAQEPK